MAKKFITYSPKLLFLVVLETLRRKKRLVASASLISLVLIFTQIRFNIYHPEALIRQGFVGTYQEHDLPLEVTRLVSESLIEIDSDGRVKPKLASGWEVNNDATIFKFKLKSNLYWSDNTKIKTQDLEFNIPDTEIIYPDEKTLQFKLKESYSPFPSLLTKPIFKKGSNLGTGPYKITKIEKSRIFITKITLTPQKSDLPKVYIRFYPNEKVAVTGFNLGEVQVLLGLTNPKLVDKNPQIKSRQKTDFGKVVTILYRISDKLLSNRSFRQALSYQSPEISGEEVAHSPYAPTSWVYDKDAKKYLSNPSQASAAYQRAKSALTGGVLNEELILTTTPNLEEVAKKVIASWTNLGFNIKLRIESGIPQNFQALLITQSIPFDPDQYFLWHSSQEKTNLTKYSSVRVDKDLEDGRKATTEEDRKSKYFDFQKTLLEDAPATFLYFPKYNIVYLKKVEGLLDKVLNLQLP